MKKIILPFLLLLNLTTIAFGQEENEMLRWNPTTRLTLNDFAIKTKQFETNTSYGSST